MFAMLMNTNPLGEKYTPAHTQQTDKNIVQQKKNEN